MLPLWLGRIQILSSERETTEKQCSSWPTEREVMTTSCCRVREYITTPSPTVQSTPVNRTFLSTAVKNDNEKHLIIISRI